MPLGKQWHAAHSCGWLPALLLCLAAGCTGIRQAAAPGAWAPAWVLEDAHLEVMAVPSIARIMHFGLSGGENLLWVNAAIRGHPARDSGRWQNFGGAKLWVAPQCRWGQRWGGWPPHHAHDAAPCLPSVRAGALHMEGAVDPGTGVSLDRTLALLSDNSVLHLAYTMTNRSPRTVSWGIWSVVQLRAGGRGVMPLQKGSHFWSTYRAARGPGSKAARTVQDALPPERGWRRFSNHVLFRSRKSGGKVFSMDEAGWLACEVDGVLFLMLYPVSAAAPVPAGEAHSEVSMGAGFVELEHVGPLKTLAPGEATVLDEYWHCRPVPDLPRTPEFVAWVSAVAAEMQQTVLAHQNVRYAAETQAE